MELKSSQVQISSHISTEDFALAKRLDNKFVESVFQSRNLNPLEPYQNKDQARLCACTRCGNKSRIRYASIRRGSGCPYCAKKRLTEDQVELVFKNAGLIPLEPYKKNTAQRLCRCMKCGRKVSPSYSNLARGLSQGCAYCSRRRVTPAEIDSEYLKADFEPLAKYRNADAPRRSRCMKCGSVVSPSWSSIKSGKRCVYCQRKKVKLSEVDSFFLSKGAQPLARYTSAKAKRRSRCLSCSAIIFPSLSNLRSGQGACSSCAKYGFDRAAPANLYLIVSPSLHAAKIGVSSKASRYDRLKAHSTNGWRLARTWDMSTGRMAERLESEVLRFWGKEVSSRKSDRKHLMPQGGWTETIDLDLISIHRTITFVESRLRRLRPKRRDSSRTSRALSNASRTKSVPKGRLNQ